MAVSNTPRTLVLAQSRATDGQRVERRPNELLCQVADKLGYALGDDSDLLVDVVEEMLRLVDFAEEALRGRDAGDLEVHAEKYRRSTQHYDKSTALLRLQVEGRLTLQQAAIFIGGAVTVEEVAHWALPSLAPEVAVAVDEMVRLCAFSYYQVATRTGAPVAVVRRYAAKRQIPSGYHLGREAVIASEGRVRQLRGDGMGVMAITRLLRAEGLKISHNRVGAICAAAGFPTRTAAS